MHLQPRWFHVPYLAFVGFFMRSGMHRAFDKYQPDAVVSAWGEGGVACCMACQMLLREHVPGGKGVCVAAAHAVESALETEGLCRTGGALHQGEEIGSLLTCTPPTYLHHPLTPYTNPPTPCKCPCTR